MAGRLARTAASRAEVAKRQALGQRPADIVRLLREQPRHARGVGLARELLGDHAQHHRCQVGQQRLHDPGLHAGERRDRADEARQVVAAAEQRGQQAASHAAEARGLAATQRAGEVAEHAEVEATHRLGELVGTAVGGRHLAEHVEQGRDRGARRRLGLRLIGTDEAAELAQHVGRHQLTRDQVCDIHHATPEGKNRKGKQQERDSGDRRTVIVPPCGTNAADRERRASQPPNPKRRPFL